MSHFVTLVITPDNTEPQEIESAIAQLLEPYSEHRIVDPYETECGCVGFQAVLGNSGDSICKLETEYGLERD